MSTWTDKNKLFLSLPVDQLLAITAVGEAGSEGGEGMMAVINVIRNRTYFSEFQDPEILNLTGSPLHAVILKPYQFSMYNLNDPVRKIAEKIGSNFAGELQTNPNLQVAFNLSQMLLAGALADNTGGATHYHTTYVRPAWAATMPVTGQIGSHIFYASRQVPAPAAPEVMVAEAEEEVFPVPGEERIIRAAAIPTLVAFGLIAAAIMYFIRR